jgi:hypothetical protein
VGVAALCGVDQRRAGPARALPQGPHLQ